MAVYYLSTYNIGLKLRTFRGKEIEKKLKKLLPNGHFSNVSITRSRTMSKIRGHNNATTEKRFRFSLVGHGIKGWAIQPKDIIGKPDIYFNRKKIAVFLDGCFWHGCPKCGHYPKTNSKFWKTKILRNKERDNEKRRLLKKKGIKVVRYWEHQIINDLDRCISKLSEIFNR